MTNEEAVRLLNTFVAATYIKGLPIGKVEDVREALDMGVVALSNSDKDSISRQAAIEKMQELEDEDIKAYGCSIPEGFDGKRAIEALKALSSIQPKTGHWIYDKSIENWRCSECKETPKTMGYCGSANFMAEHFKFCNHCGARMVKSQESNLGDYPDAINNQFDNLTGSMNL